MLELLVVVNLHNAAMVKKDVRAIPKAILYVSSYNWYQTYREI